MPIAKWNMFAGPKLNAPADPLSNAKGNSMAEDLVKRLRQQDVRQRGVYVVFNGVMAEAASKIEQQAASLAAKDKEIEKLRSSELAKENARLKQWIDLHRGDTMSLSNEVESFRSEMISAESRAEQAERALAEARAQLALRNCDLDEAKRRIAESIEIMKPLVFRHYSHSQLEIARAFVAQHGSDSSTTAAATTGENDA
jgi:chromosome segregation ATPase